MKPEPSRVNEWKNPSRHLKTMVKLLSADCSDCEILRAASEIILDFWMKKV